MSLSINLRTNRRCTYARQTLVRTEDILVQDSGNELLIYDLKTNKAFCLNETSALVWQLCNGKNTVSEMSDNISALLRTLVSEDFVWLALDQFSKDGLLENDEMVISRFAGVERREMIRKVGLASLIALPVMTSIIAPKAAMAQSALLANCAGPCAAGTDCASGNCGLLSVCVAVAGGFGFSSGTVFGDAPGCPGEGLALEILPQPQTSVIRFKSILNSFPEFTHSL